MTRSLSLPYDPNPVPSSVEELPAFLFDELRRISLALYATPVTFADRESETIEIGPAVIWRRLFDTGGTPIWEVPGGQFDNATGIWTCPQKGLYSMSATITVQPFGGVGGKSYYAGLRMTVEQNAAIVYQIETSDGGFDDVPLGVTLSGMIPLQQGDQVYVDAAVVHENQTGTVDVVDSWQIIREAGEG